ncbi:MAG: hypothetical protein AUG89_00510 [Acidobacteria bacterium 13_1_20CM_4_56_7]|nr:MAG: hypothetical protein AUG89_00510 [Acidobacteria bacterium 13_1_20CM_4_56_7]
MALPWRTQLFVAVLAIALLAISVIVRASVAKGRSGERPTLGTLLFSLARAHVFLGYLAAESSSDLI